jgi:lysophospholipid acyltransferase (LPLAT)-like uncharacterized protein
MVIRNRLLIRIVGWLAAQICRLWLRTLRIHIEDVSPSVNPHKRGNKGLIYCFWHEDLLPLSYLVGGLGIYVLISRSRDGELIGAVIESLGFRTVRGSTTRGGSSAAREIITGLGGVSAAITPDGPRGPRREFQRGAVFLASRTGMPLVPISLAYDRPWRLASWDQMVIPRPFSRMVVCASEPLAVPAEADSATLEQCRVKVTSLMKASTQRAEALLHRWCQGEQLPLVSPEAKAIEATPLRKSA